MSRTIAIDPISRIEGHLGIKIEVEAGRVVSARCVGDMFRGFEVLLKGRTPVDAQQIVQRICGVCPTSHGHASIYAQDAAYAIKPPPNGTLFRNLIFAADFLQSHIIHFYQLAALDFVDIAVIAGYSGRDPGLNALKNWLVDQNASKRVAPGAPFLPRYDGEYLKDTDANLGAVRHYLDALEMRKVCHQMAALIGGKIPHVPGLIPGGVAQPLDVSALASYESMLLKVRTFVEGCYIPDVLAVAGAFKEYFELGRGCGNYLSVGAFPEADKSARFFPAGLLAGGKLGEVDHKLIGESVAHSFYSSAPADPALPGNLSPQPEKDGSYSWIKAPRYDSQVMEVGPASRLLVAYSQPGNSEIKAAVDHYLAKANLSIAAIPSAMGRHFARAIESKLICEAALRWIGQIDPKGASNVDFKIPDRAAGVGLVEAPRGALGHWLGVNGKKIEYYHCIVPTTWNCSPRDDKATPGAVEQSLVGTPIADGENPLEAVRVVRSFDPCIACAVH